MKVTVQYQETRKPHRWINAFSAVVFYADRKIVLVRGCATESTFRPSGEVKSCSYRSAHAHAAKIPLSTYFFRLHPTSVARLAQALKNS